MVKSLPRLPVDPTATTWTTVQKLHHLRRLAETLRDAGADLQMGQWFSLSKHNKCGTAACMGGYACLDPTFKMLGLNVELDYPVYRGAYGFQALDLFFPRVAVDSIFDPLCYEEEPTFDVVIRHIDEVILRIERSL